MGVPKFYRWISERYPCLSEVVKEFQIPEFDNLYLDMNGIIHVCSHPDDNNPHFRITEEKIFRDIFHYLEFLFRIIKPRKVFFMAIDGVAPRAKMNQQRGRRFRSAREAEELERKARESGETLPTEKRFDSNCITPGTEFMVKLQEQLKYFVTHKVSSDPLWHGVDVYLSGHETPGEGEHKIMDFIRQQKSLADYDNNTRHCLYGLDADLIMLGLTSHEPHFSLLREEVRFGGHKDKNKRPCTPEETTFHLLHLSLMREYLDFEFESLKDKLPFDYDLEHVIDDWVLMGFLVGNDFIPHLPHLHIQHDALPLLWKTYMKVLPHCSGYLNEGGHLNLERFEKYMKELAKFDEDKFEETFADLKWLETKVGGVAVNMEAANVADEIRAKKMKKESENKFAVLNEDEYIGDEFIPQSKQGKMKTPVAIETPNSEEDDDIDTFDEEFTLHKRHYYMSKMEYENVDKKILREQCEGYVRAIQWILLYYYEGVPSWSWYYPHHYAPYISDVREFKDMTIEFDLSKPFLPFQQLMAVLPAASKELLPVPYQSLMTQDLSPVIDFYPIDFKTDLNGKQQDWEAVVLIPFIEENRLLEAMKTVEGKLKESEKRRNCHGPCLLYRYTSEEQDPYPSSLPGSFPDMINNHARLTHIPPKAFVIDKKLLVKGLLPGVKLDVYFPGFPTLKHIPHKAFLKKDGVKVFQHSSKNENMLLEILQDEEEIPDLAVLANEILAKSVYVAWPHLFEAKVISISDAETRYSIEEQSRVNQGKNKKEQQMEIKRESLDDTDYAQWTNEIKSLTERYRDRLGIVSGDTGFLIKALPMIGRKYICGSHGAVTLEKQFGKHPVPFLYQATVQDISVHDPSFSQFKTLGELFPVKELVFMLGWPHYGAQGEVVDVEEGESPRIRINVFIPEEPNLDKFSSNIEHYSQQYFPGYVAAQRSGISSHFLSRITGSIYIKTGSAESPGEGQNVNIGLNMKFTKRNEEMPGYTKQTSDGWTYSRKAIDTVSSYLDRFPEIVQYISHNDKNKGDMYYEDDIFRGKNVTLKEVQEYLKRLPCAQVKTMKSGTEILDEDIIKAIEQEVDKINGQNEKKCRRVKMQVKPHLLFRPIVGEGGQIPDSSTKFYLFDRVINVRHGYSVPFGLRGTVVGLHKGEKESDTMYDVVFDEAFQGGITIRCSEGRGYRVPAAAVINITYGERKNGVRTHPSCNQQTAGTSGQQSKASKNSNNTQNAWLPEGGHRNFSDFRSAHSGKQGYYSKFKDRNDNRALYQEDDYDYRNDAVYRKGYNSDGMKGKQYDQRSPRGIYPNHRNKIIQRDSVDKSSDNKSVTLSNKAAVKPDSSVQKSFDGSELSVPPAFVTPKVTTSHSSKRDSSGGGQRKVYPDSNNSEFANMWKELQIGALEETNVLPQNAQKPSLSQAAKALQKMPSPVVSQGHQEQNPVDSAKTLETLFSNASKAKVEEDQVAAMCQSMKISDDTEERQEAVSNHGDIEDGTNVLKEMLKIGSDNNVNKESEDTVKHGNKVYGRQVSLQELFEGVQCQLPPATTVASEHSSKQFSNSGQPRLSPQKQPQPQIESQPQQKPPANSHKYRQQKPNQGYHQHQRPPQKLPGQHPLHSLNQFQKRNPVMELKHWCQKMGLREPKYDFFGQIGSFVCVVTLSNGARFQGSVTRSQEEAAESAAGTTLLHVGAFRGPPVHPLMGGHPPFTQPPPQRQFSSPNSAFKPVSQIANNVGAHQYHQQYQNQMHYSQQPLPYGQSNQFGGPKYNRYDDKRNQQLHSNRASGKKQERSEYHEERKLSTETGDTSQSNPFIPMQVTRKTPQKKKGSESETKGQSLEHKLSEDSVETSESSKLSQSLIPDSDMSQSENIQAKPNGVVSASYEEKRTEKRELPKNKEVVSEKPSSARSRPKRRTRIAANFNFGGGS